MLKSKSPSIAGCMLKPTSWFLVEALTIGIVLSIWGGMFHPVTWTDTQSYLDASHQPLGILLKYEKCNSLPRTMGYPLFLRAAKTFSPHYGAVPFIQFLLFVFACVLLLRSLETYGFEPWLSFAFAGGTLLACFNDRYTVGLITESMARSMGVITIALVLLLAAKPTSIWGWVGLTVAEFWAYQVRPASLFLIPLVPVLGVILMIASRLYKTNWKKYLVVGLVFATVSIIPFLIFCSIRYVLARQFSLVPFGGYSIMGYVGEAITPSIAHEGLPADVTPLADQILRRRAELDPTEATSGVFFYSKYKLDYGRNINELAIPEAEKLYGNNPSAINQHFRRLAKSVLTRQPLLYLKFLAFNFANFFGGLLESSRIGLLLGLASLMLLYGEITLPRPTGDHNLSAEGLACKLLESHQVKIAALIAATYALFSGLLVVLVEIPEDRYTNLAGVFIPGTICMILLGQFKAIRFQLAKRQ